MNSPILHVLKKEFIEIRRSRLIGLLVVAPIIQVIVFGYVATTDIKHVQTLICDEDSTRESRRLAEKFYHTEYFDASYFTHEPSEIQRRFTANRETMALRIPKGFSKGIKKVEPVKVQVIIDGTDSSLASVALSRTAAIIREYSDEVFGLRVEEMKKALGALPEVGMEERVWYNPDLKSAKTMVPGVIGLILVLVTLVITSISLVREKESGNIEQLLVTPIKPYEIVAGKVLPYVIIGLLDIVLVTVLSMLVFGLPCRGNFALLVLLSLIMVVGNLGVGILISTVSSTQQQAIFSDLFYFLPNMLLSGFIFPIKNMPEVLQLLTYIVPLRYYMVIIRGVFLKGLGFWELLPQTLALLVFGAAIFSFAILRFRKKLF
ncbi:MAG: ABC transporter permease [Endomicrobiales bacterium]|nr:ABC transporter permease [Endomicrobiales bacterium]